jgi:sugar phosphate isomerase/epimerase
MSEAVAAIRSVVAPRQKGLQLGVTLFSLTNEFWTREYSFEQLLEQIAIRGLGPGVEVIGFQSIRGFPVVTDAFADRFRELMAKHRLLPSCLGINADLFIRRSRPMTTEESVAYHIPQIEAAAKLGFPVARYQFAAGAETIRRLVPLAERLGVILALEVHAPYKVNSPEVMAYREMYEKTGSPYLGFIPDFGSCARTVPASYIDSLTRGGVSKDVIDAALDIWASDADPGTKRKRFTETATSMGANPVAFSSLAVIFNILVPQQPKAWLEIMPRVVHIHGKFYDFDAEGNDNCIPLDQLLPLFRDNGFNGFLSSEYEGHIYSSASGLEMVARHQALCRKILANH